MKGQDLRWSVLVAVAIALVAAWPPLGDRSLIMKFVNWAVDPWNRLPVLPDPLPPGMGDSPEFVEAHDAEMRLYDAIYSEGGITRRRLLLKDARDPFDPSTTRQVLACGIAVSALYAWKLGSRRPT